VEKLCKKIAIMAIFYYWVFDKPDSVQPFEKVASIISLQIALPQNVKPSTRFLCDRDESRNPV